MPTYAWTCTSCGAEWESVRAMNDLDEKCNCGAKARRMIAGPTPVHFKGIGWYKDGYASTELGDRRTSDLRDRGGVRGKIVSFPGQGNRSSK